MLAAEDAGQPSMRDVILTQNADLADELIAFLGANDRVRALAAPLHAVAAAGNAAETTQGDPQSTIAESPRPAEATFGRADDADAAARTTPNGSDDCEPIESGTSVRYFGDYELLNVIGRGGMGVVYQARQISLNSIFPVAAQDASGRHSSN